MSALSVPRSIVKQRLGSNRQTTFSKALLMSAFILGCFSIFIGGLIVWMPLEDLSRSEKPQAKGEFAEIQNDKEGIASSLAGEKRSVIKESAPKIIITQNETFSDVKSNKQVYDEKILSSGSDKGISQTSPEKFFIHGVPSGKQTHLLSCELQVAADLAWYYGYPYTWDEVFVEVGYDPGGDPQKGWVGESLDDAPGQLYPHGYGVYAEPVARALRKLGLNAVTSYGKDENWIRQQIAGGHPVMIWAVAGMGSKPIEYWTTAEGHRVAAVRFEHTFLVIGYDTENVYVNDPWDGKTHSYPWSRFLASWDILGRMALIIEPK